MRYTLHPVHVPYVAGPGVLSEILSNYVPALPEGTIFTDKEQAESAAAYLNEYLEDEDEEDQRYNQMRAVPYVVDRSKPRIRRRHYRAGVAYLYRLAEKCLLQDDYAERRLPAHIGTNKAPDMTIFMFQLAQRFPKLQALMLEKTKPKPNATTSN